MKVYIALLFIIFSLIGIVDSSFITYEKFAGIVPECGAGFDCGEVLSSKWANIGPIPISLLGFFYYLTIFILGVILVLEIEINKPLNLLFDRLKFSNKNIFRYLSTSELLLALTSFGFLFSIYLISIMAFVIGAWCTYCLISASSSTMLFVISSIYFNKIEKRSPFVVKFFSFHFMHFGYTKLIKKIFFLFDAETAHNFNTQVGKFLGTNKLTQFITRTAFSFSHNNNARTFDGINFPNPVGLSAGFDYNGELTGILPDVGFGFHTIGTVTYFSYEGNPKPRLGRFIESKSLLVNKGLKSLGALEIAHKLTGIKFRVPTGISIASTNMHFESDHEQILDILKTFLVFEKSNVQHAYYELNISCPNTFGGEPYTTPKRLAMLLEAIEALKIKRPIYVKMPIDQSKKETLSLLNVIDQHTIAGVIIGNLTKDKNNPDVSPTDKKMWLKAKGNLSGKPTWNRSNELIKLTRKNFGQRFTIIGTGGIFNGRDALTKISHGADLLQLITGMIFEGPQTIGEINLTLARNMKDKAHGK
jgi:dihydroorotate dehydrogenase